MADKELFKTSGKDAASEDRAKQMPTLESIMAEYDAKKAAAEQKNDDHSESFEAFCREQENSGLSSVPQSTDFDVEDYDDSDMKIATPDAEDEHEEPTIEVDDSPTADDEKLDILNAISLNFRNKVDKREEIPKSPAAPEVNDEIDGCGDSCDLECPEGEVCVIEDGAKRCKPIDNETLKKAFGDGDDDLFGAITRKKKKKSRDFEEDENDFVQNTEEKKEKNSRYDENGEKIERDSKFFSPVYEYTKGCAPETIMTKLKVKLLSSCFAMVAVFFLLVISFYTEIAPSVGLPHIKALEPGKTGAIFMLFDLQLLFFAVILKLNSVIRGAVGLFTKHKTSESVAFIAVLAAIIHTLTLTVASPYGKDFVPICSVACLSVLLLSISDFLRARTEFMAFRVVGAKTDKYAFKDISSTDEKTPDEIVKYVPEGSNVLDIRKVSFVDDFFKRSTKQAPADKNTGFIILASVLASIACAAIYCFISDAPIYKAVCAFASVLLTTVQSCILISTSLTESVFSERAARRKCAFIGHEVTEDFDNVSVVSFKDTEVFPPEKISLINFKPFGNTRPDDAIVVMARIFRVVSSPISSTFTKMAEFLDLTNDRVKIVDIAPDGIWVKLDDENYYVGTASYMEANNFDVIPENLFGDVNDLAHSNATLYLASADRILIVFLLKYNLNPGFENVLRTLYTQRICARIKTLDPCINNDFIRATLRRPECLFSVVKGNDVEQVEKVEDSISSSVVSASGEDGLINCFLLIRKMKKLLSVNSILKTIAVAAGFGIAILALLLGGAVLHPALILLIQLFFTLPVYFAAKFALK